MNKEKQKAVPDLRFPTFEKADNWKDVKLIDVTDKKIKWSFTGGPFGSNLKSSDYVEENEGIRIIQLQNIGDGEFKNDYKIYTSKEKADELLSCNIYPGDIIMSKMGDPVGRACLIPDYHNRYVMSSDGIRIAVDEDKYDKYFIYLVINSKIFRSKVENSSTGSTRKRIGLIDLKKLTLTIPKDKDEQQKIANCLSSLDNLIIAETEKLDHLKDHKKGLLQQLFPAKGETKPQYRFPEFENDGDWASFKLGDLCESISSGKDKNNSEGQFKLYGSTGIIGKSQIGTFNGEHILIARVGENAGLLTKASGEFGVTDNTLVLVLKGGNNINYLYYWLYNFGLNKLAFGSGQPLITGKQLKQLNLDIPNSKEQQKIANFLSSLDSLIQSQTSKIKALKEHKKGLMQQLFPSVNDLAI